MLARLAMFFNTRKHARMYACVSAARMPSLVRAQATLLSKLGSIVAAAGLSLGGYGAGLASSELLADVQTAEMHHLADGGATSSSMPARLQSQVLPVSLTLPDQVRAMWCQRACAGVQAMQQHH